MKERSVCVSSLLSGQNNRIWSLSPNLNHLCCFTHIWYNHLILVPSFKTSILVSSREICAKCWFSVELHIYKNTEIQIKWRLCRRFKNWFNQICRPPSQIRPSADQEETCMKRNSLLIWMMPFCRCSGEHQCRRLWQNNTAGGRQVVNILITYMQARFWSIIL